MRNTRKPRLRARLFSCLALCALTLSADELADLRRASEARPQHPTPKGKSALLRVDLRSGRVLETLAVEGAHHFGDVTVAPDGEVYVSDSHFSPGRHLPKRTPNTRNGRQLRTDNRQH